MHVDVFPEASWDSRSILLGNYTEIIRQTLRYLFMISLHGKIITGLKVKMKSGKKIIIVIEEGIKAAAYD